jgi:hypothetical protein
MLVTAAVVLAAPARAEERGERGFTVFFENDSLYPPNNDDQNYTMGLSFRYASTQPVGPAFLRRALVAMDSVILPRYEPDEPVATSIELGSTNFTPEDLAASEPIPDDRPYASLIYLTSRRQSVKGKWLRRSDLDLGVLGLDVGKSVQRAIHQTDFIDSPVPRGWENQISEGGEPTLRYGHAFGRLLHSDRDQSRGESAPSTHIDLQAVSDFMVGYNTSAVAGLSVRLGRLNTPWWSFESHPLANQAMLSSLGAAPQEAGSRGPAEAYLWAGSNVRGVVYNVLLQGQFRHSEVTFSGSEIERLLWENRAGGTVRFRNGLSLTYSVAHRTEEFEGPKARSHFWGGLFLSKTCAGRKDRPADGRLVGQPD